MNKFFLQLILFLTYTVSSASETLHPATSIGGGPLFLTQIAQTQTFPPPNPQEDELYRYQTNQSSSVAGFFDLFLGLEQHLTLQHINDKINIQYGLNYHQPSVLSLRGSFEQGLDAISANEYTFQYQATPHQLLAEAKVLYQTDTRLSPYFFAGLGSSINSAGQYNTSTPAFLTFTRTYQNQTTYAFSYAIGLGADWQIEPSWRFGAAWRFNDFGKVSLGPSTINSQQISGTLSRSNLYANEVLFQLTKIW